MRKYKKRKPGSKVKLRKSTGALKPRIRTIKKKVCHCAKGNVPDDATGSTDAMSLLDKVIDEIKLLENAIDSEKIPQSAYDNFRKNMCAYCSDRQECLRSKMSIFECLKDENWEDWV